MEVLFIDREKELEALLQELSEPGLRIAVVSGRRRVGKTWLARALLSIIEGIYFFAPEADANIQKTMFSRTLQAKCSLPEEAGKPWIHILEKTHDCAEQLGGLFLVVDEFQRLGPEFSSALQLLADTRSDAPLKIVLLGSVVSLIDRLAGPLGPLYGRARRIMLQPFRFLESHRYLQERHGASPLDSFKVYSIFGGSPYNLSLVASLDWMREAKKHIHSLYGRLYDEPITTLQGETRDPSPYMTILETIARGKTSYSEIASRVPRTSLAKYLEVLRSIGVIKRVTPALEDPLRTRKARYSFSDPFWEYWFANVYPRRWEAEITGAASIDKHRITEHFSRWFEETIRELLSRIHGVPVRPWWHKNIEIDALFHMEDGSLCAVEVKYARLGRDDAERIIERLKMKTRIARLPVECHMIAAIEVEGGGRYSFDELVDEASRKTPVRAWTLDELENFAGF